MSAKQGQSYRAAKAQDRGERNARRQDHDRQEAGERLDRNAARQVAGIVGGHVLPGAARVVTCGRSGCYGVSMARPEDLPACPKCEAPAMGRGPEQGQGPEGIATPAGPAGDGKTAPREVVPEPPRRDPGSVGL